MAPSSGLKSQPAVAPSPSTTSASELIYHVRENVRSANAVKACFSSLCALSRDKATKEYVVRNFALVTQVMAAHARRNVPAERRWTNRRRPRSGCYLDALGCSLS